MKNYITQYRKSVKYQANDAILRKIPQKNGVFW
jgi:hypothetical protein